MRYLITIIFSFFFSIVTIPVAAGADLSGIDVYFINGISTPIASGAKNSVALSSAIGKPVSLLVNNSYYGGIADLLDGYVELKGAAGSVDISYFWLMLSNEVAPDSDFLRAMAVTINNPNYDYGPLSGADLDNMKNAIASSVKAKKRTLVISHSQGNFFYRNMWGRFSNEETSAAQQCLAGVGLAPFLTAAPSNYSYLTSSNDLFVNFARYVWSGIFPANMYIPPNINGNWSGHYLAETYLGHPNSLTALNTELEIAAQYLRENCLNCDRLSKEGGTGQFVYQYPVKDVSKHRMTISFEAYSIPDALIVEGGGRTLVNSNGRVSGYRTWEFDYDPAIHGTNLTVKVDAGNDGTKWVLCADCGVTPCGPKRVNVDVFFDMDTANTRMVCSGNATIDGKPATNGTVTLTEGRHTFKWSGSCVCSEYTGSCSVSPWNPRVRVGGLLLSLKNSTLSANAVVGNPTGANPIPGE